MFGAYTLNHHRQNTHKRSDPRLKNRSTRILSLSRPFSSTLQTKKKVFSFKERDQATVSVVKTEPNHDLYLFPRKQKFPSDTPILIGDQHCLVGSVRGVINNGTARQWRHRRRRIIVGSRNQYHRHGR